MNIAVKLLAVIFSFIFLPWITFEYFFNMSSSYSVFEEAAVKEKGIFLIESSESTSLNARQACAVESASHHHQNLNITLYTTNKNGFNQNDNFIQILMNLSNVKIEYTNMKIASFGTPLEQWILSRSYESSKYPIEQSSDIMRYLILWKYGGIYMDLDTITIRNMTELENCASYNDYISNGLLVFSKQHAILRRCLEILPDVWKSNVYGSAGPILLTKAYRDVCKVTNFSSMFREQCNGATLIPSKLFYIVPWTDWQKLFDREWTQVLMDELSAHKSYSVHFYGKLSIERKVELDSNSLIEVLAKAHCPLVYAQARTQKMF